MSDKPNNPSDNIIPFSRRDAAQERDPLTQELGLRPMTPEEDQALVKALMELDAIEGEDESFVVTTESDTRH